MTAKPDPNTIRTGISACLLGDEVRFDGGHKRDAFLLNTVGQFVAYVPVCPEVELGLGIPREAIRLVEGEPGEALLVGAKSGTDQHLVIPAGRDSFVQPIPFMRLQNPCPLRRDCTRGPGLQRAVLSGSGSVLRTGSLGVALARVTVW